MKTVSDGGTHRKGTSHSHTMSGFGSLNIMPSTSDPRQAEKEEKKKAWPCDTPDELDPMYDVPGAQAMALLSNEWELKTIASH